MPQISICRPQDRQKDLHNHRMRGTRPPSRIGYSTDCTQTNCAIASTSKSGVPVIVTEGDESCPKTAYFHTTTNFDSGKLDCFARPGYQYSFRSHSAPKFTSRSAPTFTSRSAPTFTSCSQSTTNRQHTTAPINISAESPDACE